jgi:AcrR family transcriptional regulator
MSSKQQILDAALRHMAARGADSASLRQIAEDVGIRKPSIMYHFASKDALRAAVLEDILARWSEVIPRLILATAANGLERFEALTRELVRFFSEDPNRARLVFREMMDRPEAMSAYVESYVQPWIKVISQHLGTGKSDGDVDPNVDSEAFVWVIVNAVIGNIALASALGASAMTDNQVKSTNARLTDELIRMARASLFNAHSNRILDPQEPSHA